MAQEEGISSRFVMLSVVITVLVVLGSVFATQAMFYKFFHQETDAKESSVEPLPVQVSNAEQLRELNKPAWVDKKTDRVKLPIDTAMELTIKERAAGSAKPAGK